MDDSSIVALYWARDEKALEETAAKYSNYCYKIAYSILSDSEDADESVNDTWMHAWNSIPPHRPAILSTFLGKITRRLSLKVWRGKTAQKRGGGEVDLALDELLDCLPMQRSVEDEIDSKELSSVINSFLLSLAQTERHIFIRRYWHLASIADICSQFGFTKSKVESMLHRTRKKLHQRLEKEGISF